MDWVHTVHVHGLSGQCPWTQWTLSMFQNSQPDNVHGQCPLSPWTFYRWVPATCLSKAVQWEPTTYVFMEKWQKLSSSYLSSDTLLIHSSGEKSHRVCKSEKPPHPSPITCDLKGRKTLTHPSILLHVISRLGDPGIESVDPPKCSHFFFASAWITVCKAIYVQRNDTSNGHSANLHMPLNSDWLKVSFWIQGPVAADISHSGTILDQSDAMRRPVSWKQPDLGLHWSRSSLIWVYTDLEAAWFGSALSRSSMIWVYTDLGAAWSGSTLI